MMRIFADQTPIINLSKLPHPSADDGTVSIILGLVFGITASIAVLIIVIAGFRYIVAHGDANATAQARNTITYAVVGLLITLAAYSIVTFVLKAIS